MISSRKSLVSSQQSSSRGGLTNTLRSRAEYKGTLVDFSVDDIFVQYSVPQIQKLQREYKSNFFQAKDDLHRLVGEKYRDLIRIAEDIDELSVLSRQIDSQLTELSYSSSKHVEFGRNPLSNFELTIRKEKARKSRASSHKTILNNIINNKLIGYDLSLQTDSLKKTSTLVTVAELYYTIGIKFAKVLQENPFVSSNLHQLKENFITYLETRIAAFSSSSSESNSGGLEIDQLFLNSVADMSDGDGLEFISGSFEEEAQELSDDEESDFADTVHRGSSYPIVNVLIAYIIVNHDNPSLNTYEKISKKFLELRYNYLDTFVTNALQDDKQKNKPVNFAVIFQYIEATCGYHHRFFISTDPISNDLQNQLKYIVSWKASDLVGFHNWFDDEKVIFNSRSYQLERGSTSNKVLQELQKFGNFTYQLASSLIKNTTSGELTEKAATVLSIFQSFVYGLRKSEVIFLSNTSECHTVKLITSEDVVSKLLVDVVQEISDFFAVHRVNLATSQASILNHVMADLEKDTPLSTAVELFTPDFVNMIDFDVDKYFTTVLDISSAANPIIESETQGNSCNELKHWFFVLQKLLFSTDVSSENSIGKISHILQRKFKDVEGVSSSWGTFSSESFSSTFNKLHNEQVVSFKSELKLFIKGIPSSLKEYSASQSRSRLQFLLNLFIILKDNIEAVEDSSNNASLQEEISKQALDIYKQIFLEVLSDKPEGKDASFATLIGESIVFSTDGDLVTVPTRPQLSVHSVMFELALSLLKSSRFRQHEVSNLYTDFGVRQSFITVKNQWIKEELIEKLVLNEIGKGFKQNGIQVEVEQNSGERGVNGTSNTEVTVDSSKIASEEPEKTDEGVSDIELDDGWDQEEEDNWPDEESQINPASAEAKNGKAGVASEATNAEHNQKQPEEAKSVEDDTNDATVNESTNQLADGLNIKTIRHALADIVFLLNFTSQSNITSANSDLQHLVTSLENASGIKLESSTLDIILRGVNEFYRSSKAMYLPLLVN